VAPDLSLNPDASPAALARRPLRAGLLRSLGRVHRRVNENSKAFVLIGLLLYPSWLLGEGPYVDYSTFRQWVQLVPEVGSLEVCGLTDAAHKLWAQKQLRVPATTFMQGDFSGTGRTDWIVQLHRSTSNRSCDYLLIVNHDIQRNGSLLSISVSTEEGQLPQKCSGLKARYGPSQDL
jgi:hypothetical protein